MQFRLSTLFLVFFNVAATLALFAPWGEWILAALNIVAILISAFLLNRLKKLGEAIIYVLFLIFICVICPVLFNAFSDPPEPFRRAACTNNLKQIGLALHNYHDAYKHFPPLNTNDKDGKPLFSWRAEILPMMEYGNYYDALKKEEPWNGPNNIKIASQIIPEYICPSDVNTKNPFTNYVAVIGPGTAWRADGPVKISDLPDNISHTVLALEIVNSDIYWAEPRDLTVEEALEGIKSGKGLRVGSFHTNVINVLFADGSVQSIPSKMDISLWKKLFAGEVKDIASIEYTPLQKPEDSIILLGVAVWLFSVVLLFRRATKSQRKPSLTA
jgi:prepilin-type processing-associated H-X9-DG protein